MKNEALFTTGNNEWYTPVELFEQIQDVMQVKFTLDPCATKESAKCDNYYTKEDDGLFKDWGNNAVFCNPPYSVKGNKLQDKFIQKAYEESQKGCVCVVNTCTN